MAKPTIPQSIIVLFNDRNRYQHVITLHKNRLLFGPVLLVLIEAKIFISYPPITPMLYFRHCFCVFFFLFVHNSDYYYVIFTL